MELAERMSSIRTEETFLEKAAPAVQGSRPAQATAAAAGAVHLCMWWLLQRNRS